MASAPLIRGLARRGFPRAEFETRFEKTKWLMHEAKLDAIVISTEVHFHYYSGLKTSFWQSPTRPFFLVLPREGCTEPIAVIPEIAAISLRNSTWIQDIRTWMAPNPADDGISLLTDTLSGLPRKFNRVGIPSGIGSHVRMPLSNLQLLIENLQGNGFAIDDALPVLEEITSIKSSLEIAKIRSACDIACDAFDALPNNLPTHIDGFTEIDLRRALHADLILRGADDVPYLMGASGANGYDNIITDATEKVLQEGDIFIMDTGTRYDNYFCDFDRNYSIGRPPNDSVAHAHRTLHAATTACLAAAKPGATTSDMFRAMAKTLEAGGADPASFSTGRMGHGLGLYLTENPSVTPTDNTPLRPGMVMTVEPGMGLPDGKMLVHEENIVITEDGCELLSRRAPEEIVVLGQSRCASSTFQSARTVRGTTKGDMEARYFPSQAAVPKPDCATILDHVRSNIQEATEVHENYPGNAATPLIACDELASKLGLAKLLVKDEGKRLGLKAFKGLGVSFAMHKLMQEGTLKKGMTVATMSAGNHGRAVAAVARKAGLRCTIFCPKSMAPSRKEAIASEGAEIVVVEGEYDDAIVQVKADAEQYGWTIISDTAWTGYTSVPLDIMAGYSSIFREAENQYEQLQAQGASHPITHLFLQAGVGGFAAAGAAYSHLSAHPSWSKDLKVIVVEPTDADCLLKNVQVPPKSNDDLRFCDGKAASIMSGLNCAQPSTVAWPVLRDLTDSFVAVSDECARNGMRDMHRFGVTMGEAGAAGYAGLVALLTDPLLSQERSRLGLDENSVALVVNTEADTDTDAFKRIISGRT